MIRNVDMADNYRCVTRQIPGFCARAMTESLGAVTHCRQGISVIAADGLLVEDCLMHGTNGTDPQAGLDVSAAAAAP